MILDMKHSTDTIIVSCDIHVSGGARPSITEYDK